MEAAILEAGTEAAWGPHNPFYQASDLPFGAPPFNRFTEDDYVPAFEAGMAAQRAEVDAIAANTAPPTFENTLAALERTGTLLNPVASVLICLA